MWLSYYHWPEETLEIAMETNHSRSKTLLLIMVKIFSENLKSGNHWVRLNVINRDPAQKKLTFVPHFPRIPTFCFLFLNLCNMRTLSRLYSVQQQMPQLQLLLQQLHHYFLSTSAAGS